MSERPILFSAPMVRAILAGRKTVTRRILALRPDEDVDGWSGETNPPFRAFVSTHCQPTGYRQVPCPYGAAGDRLWVRETWAAPHDRDHVPPRMILREARIHYAATEERGGLLWRPSIHMPRWVSRLTLEVISVRVERLHAITEEDARAEGVTLPTHATLCPCATGAENPGPHLPTCQWRDVDFDPYDDQPHVNEFGILWNTINGKRAPWSSNPWVWRVEFRRMP